MKVIITLDRYNGESSQIKQCDLENVDTRTIIYAMMSADVCGVTITKDKSLLKAVEKMKNGNPQTQNLHVLWWFIQQPPRLVLSYVFQG